MKLINIVWGICCVRTMLGFPPCSIHVLCGKKMCMRCERYQIGLAKHYWENLSTNLSYNQCIHWHTKQAALSFIIHNLIHIIPLSNDPLKLDFTSSLLIFLFHSYLLLHHHCASHLRQMSKQMTMKRVRHWKPVQYKEGPVELGSNHRFY